MCREKCLVSRLPTSSRRRIAGFPSKRFRQDEEGVRLVDMRHPAYRYRALSSVGYIDYQDLWEAQGISFNGEGRVCLQVDWVGFDRKSCVDRANDVLGFLEFVAREKDLSDLFDFIYEKNRNLLRYHASDVFTDFIIMCCVKKSHEGISLSFGGRLEGFSTTEEFNCDGDRVPLSAIQIARQEVRVSSGDVRGLTVFFGIENLTSNQYGKIANGFELATLDLLPFFRPLVFDSAKLNEILSVFREREFDGKFILKRDLNNWAICLGKTDQHKDLAGVVAGVEDKENVIGGHIKIVREDKQVKITLYGHSKHFDQIEGCPGEVKAATDKLPELQEAAQKMLPLIKATQKIIGEPKISSADNEATITFSLSE